MRLSARWLPLLRLLTRLGFFVELPPEPRRLLCADERGLEQLFRAGYFLGMAFGVVSSPFGRLPPPGLQ